MASDHLLPDPRSEPPESSRSSYSCLYSVYDYQELTMANSLRPWIAEYLLRVALSDKCTLAGTLDLEKGSRKVQIIKARCTQLSINIVLTSYSSSLHIKTMPTMTASGHASRMESTCCQLNSLKQPWTSTKGSSELMYMAIFNVLMYLQCCRRRRRTPLHLARRRHLHRAALPTHAQPRPSRT